LEIFARIPTIQELRLDEATEHTREPLKTSAIFTFMPQLETEKLPQKPTEVEPGPADRSLPEGANLGEAPCGGHNNLNTTYLKKEKRYYVTTRFALCQKIREKFVSRYPGRNY
jgi:hypothetical protein